MPDTEQLRRTLQNIGPDHSADVETAYRELLTTSDKRELEQALPDLIEPYPDEAVNLDDPRNWVSVHAWRLLRELKSPAGLPQMLSIADHPDDHLAYSEFVSCVVAAGASAARVLLPIVSDTSRSDTRRILAVKGLTALAQHLDDLSDEVTNTLMKLVLGDFDAGGDINGFAAEGLMALGADRHSYADSIRSAYAAGKLQVGSARAAALGAYFGFEP